MVTLKTCTLLHTNIGDTASEDSRQIPGRDLNERDGVREGIFWEIEELGLIKKDKMLCRYFVLL